MFGEMLSLVSDQWNKSAP